MRERMVEGQITWIVDSRITLEATINENSPLLLSGGLDIYLSNIERTLAFGEDALKNYCQFVSQTSSSTVTQNLHVRNIEFTFAMYPVNNIISEYSIPLQEYMILETKFPKLEFK